MIGRHLNELLLRLESVTSLGYAHILKDELLRWYNQDRTSIGIWRDLQSKWEEILQDWDDDERHCPLLVGETDGGFTFIWGNGLSTSPSAWFQDVRDLATPKREKHEKKVADVVA